MDSRSVLFVEPSSYGIRYKINPHMGGAVDGEKAYEQWETLVESYENYAEVSVIRPSEVQTRNESFRSPAELPDLTFCANHGLVHSRSKTFIVSNMATPQRAGEPLYTAQFFEQLGWDTTEIGAPFEGAGDALYHPERELVWLGHGVRTTKEAVEQVRSILNMSVHSLELVSDTYYHLDTCLTPLNETAAAYVPKAFTQEGIQKLEDEFATLYEVPSGEARALACNMSVPEEGVVFMPSGNENTEELLSSAGYDVYPIETSEFEKAGGSVFCLCLSF